MKQLISILLIFLFLISAINPASAGVVGSASAAVSDGLESFIINIADSLFGMAITVNSEYDNAQNNTFVAIYNAASWSPDPSTFSITTNLIEFSQSIYASSFGILLLGAFIVLLFTHYQTDTIQKLSEITGVNIGSKSNILAKKALYGIIIACFLYAGIYLIMSINKALTQAVLLSSLDYIFPSMDNFVLYFFMAIAYIFLGLFFAARILIIFLFYSFAFLIGFLLLIDQTKQTALSLIAYFIQTVFFQFIIVLYFSGCILIIQNIFPIPGPDAILYIVMIIGGIYLSIKLMFGTKVITWATKVAVSLL